MSTTELTSMLNLAHQALQRADTAAIVHAPTEELASLLIAAQRICGWQAHVLAAAAEQLDEIALARLRTLIVAARESAQARVQLARMPHEGEA